MLILQVDNRSDVCFFCKCTTPQRRCRWTPRTFLDSCPSQIAPPIRRSFTWKPTMATLTGQLLCFTVCLGWTSLLKDKRSEIDGDATIQSFIHVYIQSKPRCLLQECLECGIHPSPHVLHVAQPLAIPADAALQPCCNCQSPC